MFKKFTVTDQNGKPTEQDGPSEDSRVFLLDGWVRRYVPLIGGVMIVDEEN